MKLLTHDFYDRSPLLVAPDLLGKILVRQLKGQFISGRIVETEAYLAYEDEASHAYKGKTKRNASLFLSAGHTYVYSIHAHHCLDLVTEKENVPTSVLIRALEPLEGIELMKICRKKEKLTELTSGPGKLCQALQITKADDGVDVTSKNSFLSVCDDGFTPLGIIAGPRIGISKAKENEFRFYVKESQFVSNKSTRV